MNNTDLDFLLSEYREKKPTDFQIRKWQKVISAQNMTNYEPPKRLWLQLGAAMAAGFVVGGIIFSNVKKYDSEINFAQNNSDNATIEYVMTKLN